MKRIGVALLALVALGAGNALAGDGGNILRASIYGGMLEEGRAQLQTLAAAGDQEARFGLGVIGLLDAAEGMAQALYRHGLAAPRTGPMGPVLGIPVPANASPEPLDYEKFRAVLQTFVERLDLARSDLVAAGEDGDYVTVIDPLRIKVDVNGDGKADDGEAVAAVVGLALGGPARPEAPPEGTPMVEIGFDRADAFWLAGYSDVFAMQADFLLAHDFHEFFDATFHRIFPKAGLLMQKYALGGQLMLDPETDTAIADLIAGIHTLDWPVIEFYRLKRVLSRAKELTQLSRRNWDAILVETDDEMELVPSPSQTGIGGEKVTDEQVGAWRVTLDTADRILDGKLLLPHWRFKQGFDLEAYFETATETDFVMILTGMGALPFLRDGPIADQDPFAAATRAFGGDLIGYALWFN